jgi:hypothetical protein
MLPKTKKKKKKYGVPEKQKQKSNCSISHHILKTFCKEAVWTRKSTRKLEAKQ